MDLDNLIWDLMQTTHILYWDKQQLEVSRTTEVNSMWPPGGVLGPKTDGGVPLAAENWTQKDRGKNEIWGLKDRIL